MPVGHDVTLRKYRELLGLRPEEVVARLKPAMSVRTLERWETRGVPPRDPRSPYRDAWLRQLARLYKVSVEALSRNGDAP